MTETSTQVTFYHSAVCPRCHLSGRWLTQALGKYPHIEVTKVEYLTNIARARADGVNSIPTLVAEGRTLGGIVLTRSKIERFLESL